MTPNRIIIGSRASTLALVQAEEVISALRLHHPSLEIDQRKITTKGDTITHIPLSRIGDRGLFVKELERELLEGTIDIAVHSMKDLPSGLPPGLAIGAVPRREDPLDCLVSLKYGSFQELPRGATLGSGSLRRKAQLLAYRPDLQFIDMRGNVPTRIEKMSRMGLDGIILAAAGLRRLAVTGAGIIPLPSSLCIPAVGQGALALEIRDDDKTVEALLAPLNDRESWGAVKAERAFMAAIGGGCHIPSGCLAEPRGGELFAEAFVAASDGSRLLRESLGGSAETPEELGNALALRLIERGAHALIGGLNT
ncbi:MAG: hydroxymethylbilane synthase [Candidatus Eremiobacteraeota bacterium]|nr:hydroxymethylbilane synthase [Candidatus Eremiobacteraeota bacterium]